MRSDRLALQSESGATAKRSTTPSVLRELARDHVNQVLFVGVATFVGLGYSILLPFAFTQRVSPHNWYYLDARFAAFSVAFGLATGWIVTVQTYAVRRLIRQRGTALGGAGAVVGLLPSLLCCTPIVPTLLGFIGLSGVSLSHTSGRIQYFFATKQNVILGTSLTVLVLAGLWSTSRVVRAVCLGSDGCDARPLDHPPRPSQWSAWCCEPSGPSTPRERETAGTTHA